MKSKLAFVLIAVVGSAALAAAAQSQNQSRGEGEASSDSSRNANPTRNNGQSSASAFSVVRDGPTGYTVDESPSGVTVRRSAPPQARSYTTSTIYSTRPWVAQGNFAGEEASIAHEADQLARQLGEAKTDADREKIKTQLGDVLEKQFDERQKRHQGEIAELEAQVKKLKDLVSKRQENRREIIGRRLDQVLREAQGLGW